MTKNKPAVIAFFAVALVLLVFAIYSSTKGYPPPPPMASGNPAPDLNKKMGVTPMTGAPMTAPPGVGGTLPVPGGPGGMSPGRP